MKLKRIRSKIEEGNLTEKKLEHRTSIAKWYQPKPTTLYKKLGREILESKINFLNLSKPKCQTKQKPNKKLCFTKQSNMFYQTKDWLFHSSGEAKMPNKRKTNKKLCFTKQNTDRSKPCLCFRKGCPAFK